jgi:plastocyanin
MIDPELQPQQSFQGMQQQQQQQNDTATTAASPQVKRGALSTEATTSGNSISGVTGTMDVAAINQSTAPALRYTEQANTAIQNNDTQGASRNLNLALNELENIKGNLTLPAPGSSSIGSTDRDSITSGEAIIRSSPSPFSRQLQSHQQQQQQSQQQNQRVPISVVRGSSSLTNDAYEPNSVIVTTGAAVKWTNDDSVPHTATSGEDGTPDGRFDSGIMAPAATFEYNFAEAGEHPYF